MSEKNLFLPANKLFLQKNKAIRFFSALFMVALLVLGIAPKRTLHEIFANHRDNKHKTLNHQYPQLSNAGFNCDCDNLVVNQPFAYTESPLISSVFNFSEYNSVYHHPSFIRIILQNDLRGPPAMS